MKVILRKDVTNLGEEGDVVVVKNGYGRNYLIPQGLADLATPSMVKARNEEMKQAANRIAQKKANLRMLADRLEEIQVVVKAKVGEKNRIFGTITSTQIADQLRQQGLEIDKRKISIVEDVKVIGAYTADVRLDSEITAKLKVLVEPDGEVVVSDPVEEEAPEKSETESVLEEIEEELEDFEGSEAEDEG